jgi:NAD(P)-dependent dehydrogenase (short-subunit alcohol dehydrogenase family)
MDAGLSDRVVLVTGGGGGAGPTFCERFADEGARVAVHYRRSVTRAEATVARIEAAGGRAIAVRADLTDSAAVDRLVATVQDELGPLAVVVNNTSHYRTEALAEIADEHWGSVVEDMLGATFRVSRAAAPAMLAGGFGRIVNLTSRSGLVGRSPRSSDRPGSWSTPSPRRRSSRNATGSRRSRQSARRRWRGKSRSAGWPSPMTSPASSCGSAPATTPSSTARS